MTSVQQILIESLAQLDALMEPMRDPAAHYWAATWRMRDRYRADGLPYRGSGAKQAERDLSDAVDAGLVIRRRGRSKTVALVLTEAGLGEAWRLIGEHPWGHIIVLDELLRLAPRGMLIPEIWLNDGHGWDDGRQEELRTIQATHSQALAAGLIESNCSIRGNVAYRATSAPRPEVPPGALDLPAPKPDPDAEALYARCYTESLAWLNGQTSDRTIGEMPLVHCELGRRPGSDGTFYTEAVA